MMDLLSELQSAFPPRPTTPTDEYIEKVQDSMRAAPADDWLTVMPAYMSWCVRSPLRDSYLVVDYTIDALANFGRFLGREPSHLNFRSLCNAEQQAVVVKFLQWCLHSGVLVQEEQVTR